MLTNSAYDKIKHLVQVGLPAAGSLYFGLSQIYGWSNADKVVGTLSLIAVFLGVLLGFSSKAYNAQDPGNEDFEGFDGDLVVDTSEPGSMRYQFQLEGDPADLANKHSVTFKVVDSNEAFWKGPLAE